MTEVAALILAAGMGRRFGESPKLLADLHGKPLIRHAAEAALGSKAAWVGVVVGHRGDEVAAALAGLPIALIRNPHYAEGLSTSLKAGFAALPARTGAVVVLLGDMPSVSPAIIDGLAAAWRMDRPPAVVPTFQGRRGNPVLLSRQLAPEIATLRGDAGAGPLLRTLAGVREWPVPAEAVTVDVDTPDLLAQVRGRDS